jgi:hypothetical protein
MNIFKSKTILFNVLLAIVGSVNAFIPFIPANLVTPVLMSTAVAGLVLRVLTTVPLNEK